MIAEWTLSEAAQLLDQPQHRLIYLCERGIVLPDLHDAAGRGSSRRFSARNLFEFAVALRLGQLRIPAVVSGALLYALRSFERALSEKRPGFALPHGLRTPDAADLRAVLSDGLRLYFTLSAAGEEPRVFGGVDLDPAADDVAETTEFGETDPVANGRRFGQPEGSRHARVEISLTAIAKDLRLDR